MQVLELSIVAQKDALDAVAGMPPEAAAVLRKQGLYVDTPSPCKPVPNAASLTPSWPRWLACRCPCDGADGMSSLRTRSWVPSVACVGCSKPRSRPVPTRQSSSSCSDRRRTWRRHAGRTRLAQAQLTSGLVRQAAVRLVQAAVREVVAVGVRGLAASQDRHGKLPPRPQQSTAAARST